MIFRLALVLGLLALPAHADDRMIFTGDVLLGRGVAAQFQYPGATPLAGLAPLGQPALMLGNFEAAIGRAAQCGPTQKNPCLSVVPADLRLLRGTPFTGFGLANNHAGDLGPAGRIATIDALRAAGFLPVPSSEMPVFVRVDGQIVAVVALDLVPPRDRAPDIVPSDAVAQRLRLARALADWVVVYVHWGAELRGWPMPDQQREAVWLVRHGADLIIGAHPHVATMPSCVQDVPVFWSLGNLLFDQDDPATRTGMLAMCRLTGGSIACSARQTFAPEFTDAPSLGPEIAVPALAGCHPTAHAGLEIDGWHLRAITLADGGFVLSGTKPGHPVWHIAGTQDLLEAQSARFNPRGPPELFVVQRVYARIDGADDPRPYVYSVDQSGLHAIWRGSALGWPLRDAVVMPGPPDYLCALHRDDSFLAPRPNNTASRIAAWRWNGFGFDLAPPGKLSCTSQF